MGASGTIKAAHEVLMEMGEKRRDNYPGTSGKLVKEVLRHRNFASLSLPGLSEERKTVFVLDWRFYAVCLML